MVITIGRDLRLDRNLAHTAGALLIALAVATPAGATISSTETKPFQDGSWTMVVLPDTQEMVDDGPELFVEMMQWVVDSRSARNTQLLLHEGDIVDEGDSARQWVDAKDALSRLDGQIPYVLATGNKHYGINGWANDRSSLFNNYFSADDNRLNDPAQGGIIREAFEPDKLDNTFNEFTAPDGRELAILSLEFGPRQQVVDWAAEIAGREELAGHTAVLLTHAFLEEGPLGTPLRSDWATYGATRDRNPHSYSLSLVTAPEDEAHDGQELWDELVAPAGNFELVLNGHFGDDTDDNPHGPATTAYLVSADESGGTVHQIVANYQGMPNGGDGWLRLLEFQPDGKTVQVKTYSPTRDEWLSDSRHQFSFELSPIGEAISWQNAVQPLDVNDDGHISPLDALIVFNDLNAYGARRLPILGDPSDGRRYIDSSGDGHVTPLDALMVINHLNELVAQAEPASVPEPATGWSALVGLALPGVLRLGRRRRA